MPRKKSSAWLASLLERACSLQPEIRRLFTLMLVFRIIQAFSTLGVGIIIGIIYIWKVGLVGLGISPSLLSKIEYRLTAWHSMCTFRHVYRLHSSGRFS